MCVCVFVQVFEAWEGRSRIVNSVFYKKYFKRVVVYFKL